jgi:glycine/D-amino acid oxidase-like deaminating enzyme
MALGKHDVVIIGAGILGLASALHILRGHGEVDLLVVERLNGPGRGNTAKSAAAYRDMFTSPMNRRLSAGSIAFYEDVQERKGRIGLRRVGYLWLMDDEKLARYGTVLEYMAQAGIVFDLLETNDLKRLLPGLEGQDVTKGVLGSRCGILNQNHLSSYYEEEVKRCGGKFMYGAEVSDLMTDGDDIVGVKVGDKEIGAGTVVVANGAWMGELLKSVGIGTPIVPKKRQLFSIRTKEEQQKRLLNAKGFNSHDLLPFTILPGGAYLRPAANSVIAGFADEDREAGMEDRPKAEAEFFKDRVLPQLERYFPMFKGTVPEHSWAGHYAYNPPDNLPLVVRSKGAILVGGASGSGVMKGDAIGRVAAGLYNGRAEVELGDGSYIKVKDLGLEDRAHPPEEFVI